MRMIGAMSQTEVNLTENNGLELSELGQSIVEGKNLSGADEGEIPDYKLDRRPDASEYSDLTHIG